MRIPAENNAEEESNSPCGTDDARNASRVNVVLSAEEAEFMDLVTSHDAGALALSLREVHDVALYESDRVFDRGEKTALFHLKVLWEGLEQMGRRAG